MATGLLSLKWNNHKSTFFHVLSTIRSKESYCDVTLACDGRFYSLHKFVLSTCSEYFEEMFERTQCKHPVIVLKDIKHDDLEALLNYMYVGEVNVVQEKLAGLIKAAECLKIKGLAVPDEDPMESKESLGREQQHKRSQRTEDSPRAKRRRRENSTDVSDSHSSARSRHVRSRDHANSNLSSKSNIPPSEENQHLDAREDDQDSDARVEDGSFNKESRQTNASNRSNRSSSSQKSKNEPEEVTLDDDEVKPEPLDPPPDDEDVENHEGEQDNKEALHQELGFDSEAMGGDNNYDDIDQSALGDQLQNMEDVVADAIPGSSGFQENSFPMWEGEGSLSNFPVEGFSGDNSQARQMAGRSFSSDRADESRDGFYSILASSVLDGSGGSGNRGEEGSEGGVEAQNTERCCPYCSKRFRVWRDLSRHILTHTGEKPHQCPHCDHRSARPDSLRIHVLSKHRPLPRGGALPATTADR